MGFKAIVAGSDPLHTDVQQIIDALTGKNDVGQLSLVPPAPAPGALTVAASLSTGNLNGAYTYKVTFVTGYLNADNTLTITGETQGGTTSASVTITNVQANLTNIPTGPIGTVARRLYRTAAGGADGTHKLAGEIDDNVTTSYTDNKADASLGAAVPTTNTTGTALVLNNGWTPDDWVTWSFGDE